MFKKCGYALAPARSQVTTYLSGKHQTVPELRNGLTKLIRPLGLPDPAELPLRLDNSQPHPYLKVHNGHVYRCYDYRTTSLELMTRHARQHIRGTKQLDLRLTTSPTMSFFRPGCMAPLVNIGQCHRLEPTRTQSADPSMNKPRSRHAQTGEGKDHDTGGRENGHWLANTRECLFIDGTNIVGENE